MLERGDVVSLNREGLHQCFDGAEPPDFYLKHEDWNRWRIDGYHYGNDGGEIARVHVVWSEAGPGGEQFDVSPEFMVHESDGDSSKCWPLLGVE